MGALLSYFRLTFSCIAILLHSLGIYLLVTQNREKSNQTILLINMSATEIILSIITILRCLFTIFNISTATAINSSIELGMVICLYCAMLLILIERLIGVIFPLRHRVIVSKRRIKNAIAVAWIISVATGITGHFVMLMTFKRYFFIPADSALVLAFIITYAKILFRIIKRRQITNETQQTNAERRKNHIFQSHKRFFIVAGLIIFTYIIFIYIPDVILAFVPVGNDVSECLYTLFCLSLVSDPLVYIFLQPELRKKISIMFCGKVCRRGLTHNVSPRVALANGRVNDTCM